MLLTPPQSYPSCLASLTCHSIACRILTPLLTVITIISWLLFFVPTGFVDDIGFIALLSPPPSSPSPLSPSSSPPLPAASSGYHWLPPMLVDCYFYKGGQSEGQNFVITFVGILSGLSPPPPSLPSPLTSLACPSIACCVLGLPSLIDCLSRCQNTSGSISFYGTVGTKTNYI